MECLSFTPPSESGTSQNYRLDGRFAAGDACDSCDTVIDWPNTVMWAVRGTEVAVKEKLTTPSLCPVTVSHEESLIAVKVVPAGSTGGS